MAWTTTMVTMLRYTINDFSASPKYSDANLQTLLAIAARLVKQEITFSTTFTVDVDTPSISPDPITGVSDEAFANFTVLKAACITDEWSVRAKAIAEGIKSVCGPVSMQITSSGGKALQMLIDKGPCETYEDLKWEYIMGNTSVIKAILGPFRSNDYAITDSYQRSNFPRSRDEGAY